MTEPMYGIQMLGFIYVPRILKSNTALTGLCVNPRLFGKEEKGQMPCEMALSNSHCIGILLYPTPVPLATK